MTNRQAKSRFLYDLITIRPLDFPGFLKHRNHETKIAISRDSRFQFETRKKACHIYSKVKMTITFELCGGFG